MFERFRSFTVPTGGAQIAGVVGGSGPPVLLLHGYPQTHHMWHAVAPALAQRFTVVAADLRGYGASSAPPTTEDHAPYSKRAMAQDMVEVMARLGFPRFMMIGHDRGGRVAHRLAIDHPGAVERWVTLDIAPTREMYRNTTEAFARRYWHWFFLIRPAPLPERAIEADPVAYWKAKCGGGSAGLTPFTDDALAAYLAAWTPRTIHASCEDYRAAASIDIEHDDADGGTLVEAPLLALWGLDGAIQQCFDALSLWRMRVRDVRGGPLPGGHYLAEEFPGEVVDAVTPFLLEAGDAWAHRLDAAAGEDRS